MVYGIFTAAILLIVLYKIRIRADRQEAGFHEVQSNINELRGIAAIIIILSHSTMAFDRTPLLLMPFAKSSTICVGFFFVLSGYGLAWSDSNKKDYLDRAFLYKKLLYLFLLSILAYIYIFLISIVCHYFAGTAIIHVSVSSWWNITNWYLKMQGLMYILFFAAYRFIKNKKASCWVLGGALTAICLLFCIFHIGGRSFFISELSFFFGVMLYEYSNAIKKLFCKKMPYVMILTVILAIVSLAAFKVKSYSIADFFFHNLLCISVYSIICILFYYIKMDNGILKFLNGISLELYLCQFALFDLYKAIFSKMMIEINIWYVLGVLLTDIVVSLLAVRINKAVSRKLNSCIHKWVIFSEGRKIRK